MSLDFNALTLIGQTEQLTQTDWLPTLLVLLRLFIALILPWILGYYLAGWLRMRDYAWKLGLIFFALFAGGVIVQAGTLNLGVDLKGGVILIYEVDKNALKTEEDDFVLRKDVDWGKLIQSLTDRINPSGTKEIVIREYGDWQIEIIIPEVDKLEIEQIKKLIHTAGSLEFLIVANSTDHGYLITLAEEQAQDPIKRQARYVTDRDKKNVGFWARVDREEVAKAEEGTKGHVVLTYKLEEGPSGAVPSLGDTDWATLIQSLTDLINPEGTEEILVRRTVDSQIEVLILDPGETEIEPIRKKIDAARPPDMPQPLKLVRQKNVGPLRVHVSADQIRDANTGELLELPQSIRLAEERALERYLIAQGISEIDVLMEVDEEQYRVKGDHLGMCSRGYDETMRNCVNFSMKGQGVGLMAGMTGGNLPDKQADFHRRMGITLDGELLSAPRIMSTISDRGRITGNFTKEEVEFLVGILQAGSLPAAMKKEPIAENDIGALLGADTIERGKLAIGLSLTVVVVFILFWYRFAGFVACLALATNLLLILAFMMAFRAAVTLPGLAGLVLTVGMSVDANVLIFERLREELDRGSALRMAIRNGFGRATTTIVDANLTTLITAIVLYAIGTDQIRGFAVTLILGILMSMFTAIFCSRVVFDLFERKRRLSGLTMRRMLGETHIDFLGRRQIAGVISVAVIAVGLVAVGMRGKQIFDIDFVGGTSVTMILKEPAESKEIRSKLDDEFTGIRVEGSSVQCSVNRVDVVGQPGNTVWKIDTSLADVEQLQSILQKTFPVAYYSMESGDLKETRTVAPVAAKEEAAASKVEKPEPEAKPVSKPEADPKADEKPEARPEPKPEEEVEAKAVPETEPAAKPEVKAEAKPEPEMEAKPEPKSEAKPEPRKGPTAEPKAEDRPEPKVEDEPAKEPEESGPKPKEKPEPETKPEVGPKVEAKPETEEKPASKAETETAPKADDQAATRTDLPPDTVLALAGAGDLLMAQAGEADEAEKNEETAAKDETPAEKPDDQEPADEAETPGETEEAASSDGEAKVIVTTETLLTFGHAINGVTLEAEIVDAANASELPLVKANVKLRPAEDNPDWRMDDAKGYTECRVSLAMDQETAGKVFQEMEKKLAETPVWPSSSKIGGKVAGDTRTLAVVALLTSLMGIIGYIWIRFQRVVYGLAAVVALVHDVLITLGAIAVSYWLAGVFDFLLVEEFKISLPVVAAFLTIIGYSLNDTIVVFDRIREVRGKSPQLTSDMINTSINQTLSRTILTSLTTFIVVAILYALGGQGIHGFAFALVIGVIVGTYSSIFVASPALLWMSQFKGPTG